MLAQKRMDTPSNIVLIGMPGSGKSTVGVLLAERLGFAFLDTDIAIQTRVGRKLQEIIEVEGMDRFRTLEAQTVLSLAVSAHVIATGGSVVYSDRAMRHLKAGGIVCHLNAEPSTLLQRIDNMDSRGILIPTGQSFAELHAERQPLYLKYADFSVAVDTLTPNQVLRQVLSILAQHKFCP